MTAKALDFTKEQEVAFKFLDSASADIKTFTATLSTIGNVDKTDDVFLEGAFDKWLDTRPSKLPILWNHNRDEPIGYWSDFRMDGHELVSTGQYINEDK